MPDPSKKHLILNPGYFGKLEDYQSTREPPRQELVPEQDRPTHSQSLAKQISSLSRDMVAAIAIQENAQAVLDRGLLVEFESFEGIGKVFEKTAFDGTSELQNIRYKNGKTYATVFVPDGALPKLEKKLQDYISYRKKVDGSAHDNRILFDTIKSLKKATLKALWTDTVPMPSSDTELMCWEVWLSTRTDRTKQREAFTAIARSLKIEVSKGYIEFRERTVLLIRAAKSQLEQSLELLNNIAELRKAKTTADFFTESSNQDQKKWLDDLLSRVMYQNKSDDTPYICILDTGVNSAHPLLMNSIGATDLFTINEAWGKNDRVGHGTGIAGLALFGDLTPMLESNDPVAINHRLESSKIINSSENVPASRQPLDLYAEYTQQAVLQAEIPDMARKRLFQLAITTIESWDKGRPSSWSAALDMLSFGSDNSNNPRLFVVSAGNADTSITDPKYPELNKKQEIRDPAQSWNALTVGAYTEKDMLSPEEMLDESVPTASHGELSPYSTTSCSWDREWPYKPDIVMEGGNTAQNKLGQVQADSLSLLTTHHNISEKHFAAMHATSAASALASKMCAEIINSYPELRPETIRALVVHSATWTPEMLKQFGCDKPQNPKGAYINLVRTCGFGVPDIIKALASFHNDFTMIIEDSIQPFKKEKARKNNEVKFYTLPFPQKELEALGSTNVEMRITLSYFIEPNPSSRGRSVHSYKSHGLRFSLKTPVETREHFMGRITKALREENVDYGNDETDKRWAIGINGRTKGSIHSDIWTGSAAELASCNILAIFPVYGWWKKPKDTVHNTAKYSLLVSIQTSAKIDFMTPTELIISNRLKAPVSIDVS
ncbi:MAG: S8 family peptidase [Spirochaetaceae bacterium]|nr:S8 family peptidase [Spirochaetaceae bacterium]